MKKKFIRAGSIVIIASSIFFTCSKDDDPTPYNPNNNYTDTSPPVVTINGGSSITISLNSSFTDPGATAIDDYDGVVSVASDASTTNPNANLVGTYTVTYTSTDHAGNTGTATRTVLVINDAIIFDGMYLVSDDIAGTILNYSQNITADDAVNNKVHFSLFCDYANNDNIYAFKQANGSLEIPIQAAANIGSGPGPCDIATHTFMSTGYTSLIDGFKLYYDDNILSPASCSTGWTGIATYTRQ